MNSIYDQSKIKRSFWHILQSAQQYLFTARRFYLLDLQYSPGQTVSNLVTGYGPSTADYPGTKEKNKKNHLDNPILKQVTGNRSTWPVQGLATATLKQSFHIFSQPKLVVWVTRSFVKFHASSRRSVGRHKPSLQNLAAIANGVVPH